MSPGVREARRDEVLGRIVEIGRRHLTEYGAAGLSLRAVTRDLGMVSSAVYRYVADRDALLTLLVVDAYTELGDEVDAALHAHTRAAWDVRVLLLGNAVRDWAVREPARWALLYGSPVPGYRAPEERTVEPGTRVIRRLLELVAEGVRREDIVDGDAVVAPGRALRADLRRVAAAVDLDVDAAVLGRGLLLYADLVGSVSLEVFGQYGEGTFAQPGRLFDHQLRLALSVLRGTFGP